MALLEDVKLALRISHNLLDDEISNQITSARQELVRAGVSADVALGKEQESNLLVEEAIKVYVIEKHTRDTKEKEGYAKSFEYQLDNLRKSFPEES